MSLFSSFRPLALLAMLATARVLLATDVAVATAPIQQATLHAFTTAYGNVAGHPSASSALAAGAAGQVVKISVTEGQSVKAGTLLVQLDSRAAAANQQQAQTQLMAAEMALARLNRLRGADGTSERALQEATTNVATARAALAAAHLALDQLSLLAPFDGTITELKVAPGQWLDAGQFVGNLTNFEQLVIEAQIPLSEVGAIAPGQVARVFTDLSATAEIRAEARVDFISPQVVPGTDQVLVRLPLEAQVSLRLGQLVALHIVTAEQVDCLVVPAASVFTDAEGQTTLSLVVNGISHQVTVQPGLREGNWVEVSSPELHVGDIVVTTGSFALPESTPVRVTTTAKAAEVQP